MKQYIIEFIGTFFLVLVIALTGNPLAIGVVLTALVYMGGYISGANYNPAVTLSLWTSKKMSTKTAGAYMLSQLLGGIAAAAFYSFISNKLFIPQPGPTADLVSALLIEFVFTFLLASVVLHVAATDKTKGNDYYGLAIGFTVMAIAFAGGPISGGAYNPAVGVGPLLFDFGSLSTHSTNLLIYLLGPLAGGALAGTVYKKLS